MFLIRKLFLWQISGTGNVGAAVKRHRNWTGVYLSVPSAITPGFLRAVALEADIHPIGPEGDATYAGNGFLVIHATTTGEKKLHWQGKCNLLDLSSGKIIAKNTDSYTCVMNVGETRWFHRENQSK